MRHRSNQLLGREVFFIPEALIVSGESKLKNDPTKIGVGIAVVNSPALLPSSSNEATTVASLCQSSRILLPFAVKRFISSAQVWMEERSCARLLKNPVYIK